MLDPAQLLLCEHDREPGECPLCDSAEAQRPEFDPLLWLGQIWAEADELRGVPFS